MFFKIGDAIRNRESGDYGIIDSMNWGDYVCKMVNGNGEYTVKLKPHQMQLITPVVCNEVIEGYEKGERSWVIRIVSISNVDFSFPETDTTLMSYYYTDDDKNYYINDENGIFDALSDDEILYEICDYFGIEIFDEHHENHDVLCFRYLDKYERFAIYNHMPFFIDSFENLPYNGMTLCDLENILRKLGLEVVIIHKIVGDMYND